MTTKRFACSLRWAAACSAGLLIAPPAAAMAASGSGGTTAPGSAPAGPSAALLGGIAAAPAALAPGALEPPAGGARVGGVGLVRGRLSAADAGQPVVLQLSDRPHHAWVTVGSGRADASGVFAVAWRPKRLGRFALRALNSRRATASGLGAGGATGSLEVYRTVIATVFGPGFYGSRTACGQVMTPLLMGVAHRTLPCGTPIDIVYGNRTITVPVVDRGPYANGASYDLTTATAAALGVDGTVRIGALAVPGAAPAAP